jgi:mannose-P-dolichol utilization defect protein 1
MFRICKLRSTHADRFLASLLVIAYSRTSAKPLKALGFLAIAGASGYLLFSEDLLPMDALRSLLAASIPLSLSSKVPQISKIWQSGTTGQLSAFLVFNSLAGCLARVFTTATETGDRTLWWSFVSASVLNAVIAAQMLYYWNDSGAAKAPISKKAAQVQAKVADRVQEFKEKSGESQPAALPAKLPVGATPAKPTTNVGVAPRSVSKSAGRSASSRYTRKVD